jgi:hypothetical protein
VLVLWQEIVQSSPHETLQFGPLEHAKVQWSVHVALQLLPKLEHVGAHGEVEPQSSVQALPPWHAHDEPVHCGPEGDDEQATASATSAAIVADSAAAVSLATRVFMACVASYPLLRLAECRSSIRFGRVEGSFVALSTHPWRRP